MGLSKELFVLLSALKLDKYGRRPLLLLGSAGMVASLFGLGLGSKFLDYSTKKPMWAIVSCIVAVCADVSFFNWAWAHNMGLLFGNFFHESSPAISVNQLVSGVVSMTFLSISHKITFGGILFMFAGIMLVGMIFFYFFLPETKGRTLEEMETIFKDKDTTNVNRIRAMRDVV